MVVDLFKMHFIEIKIKNRVCNNYFDSLIKGTELETKKN